MVNNCLVTKLKGAVNNPDLIQLGHYRFLMDTMYSPTTVTGVGCTISLIKGSAKVYDANGDELSFPVNCDPGSWYRFVATTPGETFVLDSNVKYTENAIYAWLTYGVTGSITLQDLESFPALTYLSGGTSAGALRMNFDEDIAEGRSYPKYTYMDFRVGELLGGDISRIPLIFPNLEGADSNHGAAFYLPGILHGSIENFIRSWRSIGKTTGTFRCDSWVRNEAITFNDHNLASDAYDGIVISWTETTMTITKTNGETETINA